MATSSQLHETFRCLAKHSNAVISILNLYLEGATEHFSREYLLENTAFTNRSKIIGAINALSDQNILVETNGALGINLSTPDQIALKYLLQGRLWAKEMDGSELSIVMTAPKAPSTFKSELATLGHKRSLINGTQETFEDLARKSMKKFTVMSPFLDELGAEHLVALFEACAENVEKELILRFLSEPHSSPRFPTGFLAIRDKLTELGVSVFDYSIERPGSNLLETFHAKVMICDSEYAYLGSSNFHKYSIENSMELGALITGPSVNILRNLLDVIVSISKTSSH